MSSSGPAKNDSGPSHQVPEVKPKRLVARSLIGILFALMAVELFAYGRLLLAHRQFVTQIQMGEMKDHRFTKADVLKILGGREPDESKMVKSIAGMKERFDVYYFWGLMKTRPLVVHYGVEGFNAEPEVLEVATHLPDEYLATK